MVHPHTHYDEADESMAATAVPTKRAICPKASLTIYIEIFMYKQLMRSSAKSYYIIKRLVLVDWLEFYWRSIPIQFFIEVYNLLEVSFFACSHCNFEYINLISNQVKFLRFDYRLIAFDSFLSLKQNNSILVS